MTEQELKEKIAELDKQWEEQSEQMKSQFQIEYGAYLGRKSIYTEMLEKLTNTDKGEKPPK